MKKRIFFIVEQLNLAGSAEYLAVQMATFLSDDFDVFLYSLEEINKGRVNSSFNVNSRIRINSLNLPVDEKEKEIYLEEHRQEIIDFFAHSTFEEDIYFVFTKLDGSLLPNIAKKVWVDGFEDMEQYDKYDMSIFFSKKMLVEKQKQYPELENRFIYLKPFARLEFKEDFKFHGNHLFAISKLRSKKYVESIINLALQLREHELKYLLTISCQGTYLDYFKSLVKEHDLSSNIEVVTFNELKQGLSNADLFIYASTSKYLPTTVIEAIVNSVPVICASKNEYARELIEDSGIIVKNEEDLCENIIAVLKDKIKLSKLKFATYESSHRFSSKESLKSLVKLILILEK